MVRVYMLEALLDVYGHHMDNDWNNLVTRGFDEAQEKVSVVDCTQQFLSERESTHGVKTSAKDYV